jgi:aminopeptidase N
MREPQPRAIHLKDYAPPAFRVETVELDVDIRDDHALVRAQLQIRRNRPGPLVLDGDELELVSVALDGKPVRHQVTAEKLTVPDVPDAFTLETVSRIVPQNNTKLEGLYATRHGFVTQCEAEGFRRITWFIDRPDVMAVYTTTVRADPKKYPVLLSNGNLVASGPGWAKFHDPFPKPSYLFALVAANLEVLKEGNLYIYVEPGKLDQAGWAMDCLKRAIAWDEKRFGLSTSTSTRSSRSATSTPARWRTRA